MSIMPRLDREVLTRAHETLCRLEAEMKASGRIEEAGMLSYVDLIVLAVRNKLPSVLL